MSVVSINGLPGKGKNVLATYLAIKHYKTDNSFLKRFIRKVKGKETILNTVYSTYPILLDKKKKIFSNVCSMHDLNVNNRFKKNSIIIIDETQAFYDSDDFKIFPKSISVFCQFHRHFDIDDIYFISQHPDRIVKKLRDVSCEFNKIRLFFCIPILKIGFMYISRYYEEADYGKWHHPKKEAKTYDVSNKFLCFFAGRVFSSYNSKYLNVLNRDSLLLDRGTFNSLYLSKDQIYSIFRSKYF